MSERVGARRRRGRRINSACRASARTRATGYKLSCTINRAANMHEEGVARVVVAPGVGGGGGVGGKGG